VTAYINYDFRVMVSVETYAIEKAIKNLIERDGMSRQDAIMSLLFQGASSENRKVMADPDAPTSKLELDEREMRLIRNCLVYAENDPAGLPGHNLMIIIAKMAEYIVFK
jgi:hypothetical protein